MDLWIMNLLENLIILSPSLMMYPDIHGESKLGVQKLLPTLI